MTNFGCSYIFEVISKVNKSIEPCLASGAGLLHVNPIPKAFLVILMPALQDHAIAQTRHFQTNVAHLSTSPRVLPFDAFGQVNDKQGREYLCQHFLLDVVSVEERVGDSDDAESNNSDVEHELVEKDGLVGAGLDELEDQGGRGDPDGQQSNDQHCSLIIHINPQYILVKS